LFLKDNGKKEFPPNREQGKGFITGHSGYFHKRVEIKKVLEVGILG
jgi:hypothetical protein